MRLRDAVPSAPDVSPAGGRKAGNPFYTLKNRLEPVKTKAAAVSLMKSERIEGRLVYTELYRKELRENKGKEAML